LQNPEFLLKYSDLDSFKLLDDTILLSGLLLFTGEVDVTTVDAVKGGPGERGNESSASPENLIL